MGDFKINEKTVFTQSGSDEPAMGSTVTGIPAAGVTGVLPVAVTGGSGLTHLASNPTVTLGSNATFPTGQPVQVLSTTKTDTFSSASPAPTPATVTGLTVEITPRYLASKIFVIASFGLSSSVATTSGLAWLQRKVASGSYATIGAGADAGSAPRSGVSGYYRNTDNSMMEHMTAQHLDAPSYTAGQVLTYAVAVAARTSSYSVKVGFTGEDSDDVFVGRPSSIITVMEIAA